MPDVLLARWEEVNWQNDPTPEAGFSASELHDLNRFYDFLLARMSLLSVAEFRSLMTNVYWDTHREQALSTDELLAISIGSDSTPTAKLLLRRGVIFNFEMKPQSIFGVAPNKVIKSFAMLTRACKPLRPAQRLSQPIESPVQAGRFEVSVSLGSRRPLLNTTSARLFERNFANRP